MLLWEWLEGLSGGAASFVGSLAAFVFGIIALIIGAIINFSLNRRRDDRNRRDEALSVAAAFYGEILMLRKEIANAAKMTAIARRNEGTGSYGLRFDEYFLDRVPISEPLMYTSLAPKIGLLHHDIVTSITEFYGSLAEMKNWLPRLVEDKDRKYSYSVLHVLEPAHDAVFGINPTLRQIEELLSIQSPAADPDFHEAEDAIDEEQMIFQENDGTVS